MESSMNRLVSGLLACLVVCGSIPYTAQDGYCFRYRNPIGPRGKCRERIEKAPGPDGAAVDSPQECCILGGEGWSEKVSGKKCADACLVPEAGDAGQDAPEPVEEESATPVIDAEGLPQNIVEWVWGRWSDWQPCSVTCGSGFSERRRECSSSSGQPDENVQCEGDRVEHRSCNSMTKCPVHGRWGQWSPWTECSATCGDTMARFRECDSPTPQFGGNGCAGDSREVQWCNGRRNCPINGGWKAWSAWSPCSATCGRHGKERRFRTCSQPVPRHGGLDCNGDTTATRPCRPNANKCPVDGGWSDWGTWKCPADCVNGGEGRALRTRRCSNPKPLYGGRYCEGNYADRIPCLEIACAVDGMWSMWSSWGECSSTCGEASFQSRTRRCDNPKPTEGGRNCLDLGFQTQLCDVRPCTDAPAPPCDDEDFSGEGGSGCVGGSGDQESSISSLAYDY